MQLNPQCWRWLPTLDQARRGVQRGYSDRACAPQRELTATCAGAACSSEKHALE